MFTVFSSYLTKFIVLLLRKVLFKFIKSQLEFLPHELNFIVHFIVNTIDLASKLNFILIARIDESSNAFIQDFILFYIAFKFFF